MSKTFITLNLELKPYVMHSYMGSGYVLLTYASCSEKDIHLRSVFTSLERAHLGSIIQCCHLVNKLAKHMSWNFCIVAFSFRQAE